MNVILNNCKISENIKMIFEQNKEIMKFDKISKRRFQNIIYRNVLPTLKELVIISNLYSVNIDSLLSYDIK